MTTPQDPPKFDPKKLGHKVTILDKIVFCKGTYQQIVFLVNLQSIFEQCTIPLENSKAIELFEKQEKCGNAFKVLDREVLVSDSQETNPKNLSNSGKYLERSLDENGNITIIAKGSYSHNGKKEEHWQEEGMFRYYEDGELVREASSMEELEENLAEDLGKFRTKKFLQKPPYHVTVEPA
jgi:hypothetical protein